MAGNRTGLIREGFERWNAGDRQWVLDHMTPDVEWVSPTDDPDPDTYRGHDGVENFWETWREAVGAPTFEIIEMIERGEDVLVENRRTIVGKGSGAEISDIVFQRFSFREDDMCFRVTEYYRRENAYAAMGVGQEATDEARSRLD